MPATHAAPVFVAATIPAVVTLTRLGYMISYIFVNLP